MAPLLKHAGITVFLSFFVYVLQDLEMVENALMENGLDEDRALAEVLQLMSLSEPGR